MKNALPISFLDTDADSIKKKRKDSDDAEKK